MEDTWEILVKVIKKSRTIESPENLDPHQTFTQQNIDSLDLAGIFLSIEDSFDIRLLDDPAHRPKSFQEIVLLIDSKKIKAP